VYSGPIGSEAFVWPTSETFISGYEFSPEVNHWGIDIGGDLGNPIYAADAGVVVYAGWNDWGYGNVIVLDHGNGWQTLYAHLSEVYVNCGITSILVGSLSVPWGAPEIPAVLTCIMK
jgi:murein DD-endopeptidase MepM/ murein hydrolase activator NlpD